MMWNEENRVALRICSDAAFKSNSGDMTMNIQLRQTAIYTQSIGKHLH